MAVAETSDLAKTSNYILDNILGLDSESNLLRAFASDTVDKDGNIEIVIKVDPAAWSDKIIALLPSEIFIIKVDPAKWLSKKLDDIAYTIEVEKDIRSKLDGYVGKYVDLAIADIDGVERGVAQAATNAIKARLSATISKDIPRILGTALVNFEIPEIDDFTNSFEKFFDDLGADYFELFVPELAKTFGKLGLTEILAVATSDLEPEWATAVKAIGEGVLTPVIDNIVHNYFAKSNDDKAVFDSENFFTVFGNAMAGLLIDFKALDEKIIDDILGIDGNGFIDEALTNFLSGEIQDFVKDSFVDGVKWLSGQIDETKLAAFFENITTGLPLDAIQSILGSFFLRYGGEQLAQLFVEIDSLPESVLSQIGSVLASEALGAPIGQLALGVFTDLFGSAAATAVGATIFEGLGTILGAGLGAIAGSIVFELLDDLFDGAISGVFNQIFDWIRNDSPQAFYGMTLDADSGQFVFNGNNYSKDSNNDMRAAVKAVAEAWADRVNDVLSFIDEPVTIGGSYQTVTAAWGKKHYDSKYATTIGNEVRIVQSSSPEHVVNVTIGTVLYNTSFANGHPTIARAYEEWKILELGRGNGVLGLAAPVAYTDLQEIIGLAKFAAAYRQNPDIYDALIAGDSAVGITIPQQFFEATTAGYLDAETLRGSNLRQEEIGSASAGDTIVLDYIAHRAIARGGDDTIVTGTLPSQYVDGGTGTDTIVLASAKGTYELVLLDRRTMHFLIKDSANGITIEVKGVEVLQFASGQMLFGEVFVNNAPAFANLAEEVNGTVRIAEGGVRIAALQAVDPDAETVTYALSGLDASAFTIDRTTGVLAFRSPSDFEAAADSNHDNVYEVTVEATDGFLISTRQLRIQLDNVRELRTEGNLVVGSAGNDTVGTGLTVAGQPFASVRDDTIYGFGGRDLLYGDAGNDRIVGGLGADTLYGDTGHDALAGEAGDDLIYGGPGNDVMAGGDGNDTVFGDDGDDTLAGGAGNDQLWGYDGNDRLSGDAGQDVLHGEAGADRLDGGAGRDFLVGGAGDDTYVVSEAADQVGENAGEGLDSVLAQASYALVDTSEVEQLSAYDTTGTAAINLTGNRLANLIVGNAGTNVLTGLGGADRLEGLTGDDRLFGGADADTLVGGTGNDLLDGGAGADMMLGGAGDDIYAVDSADDQVNERGAEGLDTVVSTISLVLAANVENLRLDGMADLDATGNTLANSIQGNAGRNTLDGGAGADVLAGGAGDDLYRIDHAGDQIVERFGEGMDTVVSSVSLTMAANVEVARLDGLLNLTVTGNGLANTIYGNAGRNVLDGGGGADVLVGGEADDAYIVDNMADQVVERAGQGTDTIISTVSLVVAANVENARLDGTKNINVTGNALANRIEGNAGQNILDGAGGADILIGAQGDDVYMVDNAADLVIERADEGIDTVISTIAITLASNAEILKLGGTRGLAATGNSLDNTIHGNGGNNAINGGRGNDILIGGGGDDTYWVDTIADQIIERANEGIDTVVTSLSLTLASNVEILRLEGTRDLSGTGNGLDNTIYGTAGNNMLDGAGGSDTLIGAAGDDTYFVDNAADQIVERFGEGTDTIVSTISLNMASNVEVLRLEGTRGLAAQGNSLGNTITGNSGSNVIDGGAGRDILSGGDGDDTLIGGEDQDVLTGGSGRDVFVFNAALNPYRNTDQISDFVSGTDRIALDPSIFSALSSGPLASQMFEYGAVATQTETRLLFNSGTGEIWYDADGTGSIRPVLFAQLNPGQNLVASDFLVL